MIHYNMRYRGPYEYEKFVLNTLQYSNLMTDFDTDANELEEWKTLKEIQKEVDQIYKRYTDPFGKNEVLYRRFIMLKEDK